jgi:hypothetical protein
MMWLISIVAGLFALVVLLRFFLQPYLTRKTLRELGMDVHFLRMVKDSYFYPLSIIEECAFLLKENEIEFTYEDIQSLIAMRRDDYQEAIRHIVGVLKIEGKKKSFAEALMDFVRNK